MPFHYIFRVVSWNVIDGRGQLKCDGTRAETRFRLSAKRTSPFKSAGASVQSTTGSRGVRISGSGLQLKCDDTREGKLRGNWRME